MALNEVEIEDKINFNELLSKPDDETDSNSGNRNIETFNHGNNDNDSKDEEGNYNINDMRNDLVSIKNKELMQHLKDLKQEYSERIHTLEQSLDHVTRENEAYDSQIAAIKQHNKYLHQAHTQSQQKHNETKLLLLNAKEEIMNLKTELTNLQILYKENVQQIGEDNKVLLQQIGDDDDNDINNILNQYVEENKQIKKENIKYLNQLKEMNNKYRESNTKYDDLNNIQMDTQNELNEAKSRVSDLDNIVHEYFLEIRYLEHQNAELKQTLNEITNSKELYDRNGQAISISYPPDIKPKMGWRKRSISQVSGASSCNSPTVNFALSPESNWNINYDDDGNNNDDTDSIKPKENTSSINDEMEKFYDLYQRINDYLEEIEDCVQKIKTVQLLHSHNKKERAKLGLSRSSNTRLSTKHRNNNNNKNDDEKEDGEQCDNDEEEEDDDDDLNPEDLLLILDKNEEQQQLIRIADIIQESKECVTEMRKQQIGMMTAEKERYDELDATYQQHKVQTARKIKRLTKDMYTIQYKKYGGYRHIAREMLGNVGTYTKDAIVLYLTH